jgi:pimeloyl-ACP methyl ester carboxylesterase
VDTFDPVNGHRMHVMIEGSGPSVILSGGGGVNDTYSGFQPLVSSLKAVEIVVQELDSLFSQAGLKAPFVLVGHSMASPELLHYAQTFPAKGNALEVRSVVENAKTVLARGSLGDLPLSYFYAGSNGIAGWADAQKGLSEFSNQAEALLIPEANHFIYEKNAEAIAAKVKEFL